MGLFLHSSSRSVAMARPSTRRSTTPSPSVGRRDVKRRATTPASSPLLAAVDAVVTATSTAPTPDELDVIQFLEVQRIVKFFD